MFPKLTTHIRDTGDMALGMFNSGARWYYLGWDLCRYGMDFAQRATLMADVLRRRGNQYFDYVEAGMPPLTPFPLEPVMDGRTLDRPVNRMLVRIEDRRDPYTGRRIEWADQDKRPIIFQDPDAGRGLISASRDTSEIGLAIDTGHPTFLILVLPETIKTQTMDDLLAATQVFIAKVADVCPHEKPPAFIGNCQAGWQMALSAAQSPGLPGPVVPVGAPMSYWSRGKTTNSLRYTGGLALGSWLPLFFGDLGNGVIDGLPPLNFELFDIDRHPILDSLKWLQEVDDQRKIDVFLTQQKWVYGFHQIAAGQFYWIVRELFIGNKLERGLIRLDGRPLDLAAIKEAIVFTSHGDTITPVAQGIGWIPRIWKSSEEMKRAGVKIALIHHERAGHLAIFVSAKVADKEHRQILGVLGDDFDALPPGLYRMEVSESGERPVRYATTFREIDPSEIRDTLDDSDRVRFHRAAVVSECFDRLYRVTARPLTRLVANAVTAEALGRLHPMRSRVSAWADRRNPWAFAIQSAAQWTRENRMPMDRENPFFKMEQLTRTFLGIGLELFKETRDAAYARSFDLLYGDANPLMKTFLPPHLFADDTADPAEVARRQFPSLYRQTAKHVAGSQAAGSPVAESPATGPGTGSLIPLIPSLDTWRQWMSPSLFAGGMKRQWPWPMPAPDKIPMADWAPLFKLMADTADSFKPMMTDLGRWAIGSKAAPGRETAARPLP